MKEVVIEVWGDFACFTMPQAKVERLTYPFPPPSAARGILSAIYMKPKEFLWRVHRIEVLEPIRYISFKRNEIKCTVSSTPVSAEEDPAADDRPPERALSHRRVDHTAPGLCGA